MRPAIFLLLSLLLPVSGFAAEATPADQLTVPPGFKVELLRSASEREGSWVSMAVDDKGRLYISPQGAIPESGFSKDSKWGGLWRATLDDAGQIAAWDKVPVPVGDAMGMLWAFDSLYVSGEGPEGRGIYRLKNTNGDDTLDSAEMWKKVPGGNGEHGAHALVLGPDSKSIYIVHGNATPLVEDVDANSPYRNYGEDILIPRVMDPVATFFDNLKIPYGTVLRTDENGTKWELMAGGFRNPYDIDFNADGELFTYDSDMEWDVGLPWYRPTRILHVVPGGEFGFREGNQKWPEYYEDSLPAAVNIGLGCPTGVKFGTKSNFPEKYRRAFFVMDWTFGRLMAVHLHPKGASYVAANPLASYTYPRGPESSEDVEVFLSGKGMPLTDLEFGKDGAMYLTVGGRGTQGGLYRVSWDEKANAAAGFTAPVNERRAEFQREETAGARLLRHELVGTDTSADHLAGFNRADELVRAAEENDRFIYFLARVRAENLPLEELRKLALEEPQIGNAGVLDGPVAIGKPTLTVKDAGKVRARDGLSGLLALARVGPKETQAELLGALKKFPFDSLDDDLKLLKLRVIKLSFIRQGRPAPEMVSRAIEKLGRIYPATGPSAWPLNRELSELLVWLGAPDVVEKTLALMDASNSQEEQIWYACMLRVAKDWTPEQRERYFTWFSKAQNYHGGNSLTKFIERIRDQALENAPDDQRQAMLAVATKAPPAPEPFTPTVQRDFQKAWTMADLEADLPKAASGRNLERGKEIYASTQCASCHLFHGGKGNVGPDLSAVGQRFQRRDILEAILDPSKAISEQYASVAFTMNDGKTYAGRIANETNYNYDVIVDPVADVHQLVVKTALKSKEVSPVSTMPPGLINVLTKEEILDLLAYLATGGDPKAPAFAQ
ncbi:MAG: c-type cytochrome [Chthoniobacteraceae bacterium]